VVAVRGSILIDRPIGEVFDYVTDLRNEPWWWRGIRCTERLGGDGGIGTCYWQEARLLGSKVHRWEVEVAAHERPFRQTIVGSGPISYVRDYRFTPGTRGTCLRLHAEAESGPPWSRWGYPLRPLLSAVVRRNLDRLNRILTG
jgi:Polyketide cyclase / dehydrase and lipid transport